MSSTKNPLHRLFHIDVAAHGDLSATKLDPKVNLEVISLGLSRTGTTSLQVALTKLGCEPTHGGVDLFRSMPRTNGFIDLFSKLVSGVWAAGDPALTDRLRSLMSGYRSATDVPLNMLIGESFAAYPDAKYILTVRPGGAEEWWTSFWNAGGFHFRSDIWRYVFRVLIYPVYFIRRTDDKVQLYRQLWLQKYGSIGPSVYDKHNSEVMRTIPNGQLLVYDVRDGWEPLCTFLEVKVPEEGFPRLNDTKAMQAIYMGMMSFGAMTWALYIGAVAGASYLAFKPEVAKNMVGSMLLWCSQLMANIWAKGK